MSIGLPEIASISLPSFDRGDAALDRAFGGDRNHAALALGLQRREHLAAGRVIDADDADARRALGPHDRLLGRDIAFHPAMAVEMVRRDVEQDRDVGDRRSA